MRNRELIFNLYVYSNLDLITEVGGVTHFIKGNEDEKIKYLQENVFIDFESAKKFKLPANFKIQINDTIRTGIDYNSYRNLCKEGHGLTIFETLFVNYNASQNPLVVVTPVINGQIKIEGIEKPKLATTDPPKFMHIDKQKEWYVEYIDNNKFHFDKLINDDFFEAIRILYNAKHYVSSMKLLMICLDTIAYLEFGDVKKNFHNWLNTYVDLTRIDITEDELWEFRNSILHMTNLDSRKVQSGQIRRLMFYVADTNTKYISETDEGKQFNFKELLDSIAIGISNWGMTYNTQKENFEILLNRYDRIISDNRKTTIYYNNK